MSPPSGPGYCPVFNLPYFPLKSRLTLDVSTGVSLGQLWLELLRFYTLEFALEEYIISIRLKELLSREMKNWPRRRLAIEGDTTKTNKTQLWS